MASESRRGLGRLVLLIGLAVTFCWRGPDGALGLKWGDTAEALPETSRKLGITEKGEQAWSLKAEKIPLCGTALEVNDGEALFAGDGGLKALMFRLHPARDGEEAAAVEAARRLTEALGPAMGGKKAEALPKGLTLEWQTRRSTVALGQSIDGSYNLLLSPLSGKNAKESP